MRRRLDDRPGAPNGGHFGRTLRAFEAPGLTIREAVYDAASVVPRRSRGRATLCLNIEGGYRVDWGRVRLDSEPVSLLLYAPGAAYGARISDAGSRCLSVAVDPASLDDADGTPPDFEFMNRVCRAPPHWLAFELRLELELADDLSAANAASLVLALLAALGERPGFEPPRAPPPWLERVRARIDDEFRRHHTLDELARPAGVHRVHLAREFHRRFGCTVGHYIRQRRIEFACRRLMASRDPLAEIAIDAGFADQSHLTNAFRRLIGKPPGAFRARFGAHSTRRKVNPLQDGSSRRAYLRAG